MGKGKTFWNKQMVLTLPNEFLQNKLENQHSWYCLNFFILF